MTTAGNEYIQQLCLQEFQRQVHHPNERPIEYRFLFEQLGRFSPGRVLDVGTGATAVPSLIAACGIVVTAIDNVRDFWPQGMVNRHFHVMDDDITAPRIREQFDMISCISVIEHIRPFDDAVRAMFGLLKPRGHLLITCPYSDSKYRENVYEEPDSDAYGRTIPYICRSYSRVELARWLQANQATLIKQEFWRLYTGAHWSCGAPIHPPVQVERHDPHQLTCLLLQKDG